MLKVYQKYIIRNFLSKFFIITFIFFSLILLLGSLEELNFSRDLDKNFFFPYFLTLLNGPITLFEIFPFILLLSTQFFFYDIFKKNELILYKSNGLNNLSILKVIFLLSIGIGIVNIVFFYNIASNLKFFYSDTKNQLSTDNKYLAMVTKSGLWIKDEVENKKYIIKSTNIKDNIISNTIINIFDENYNLSEVIQSKKIDIKNNNWVIYNPIITKDNQTVTYQKSIRLKTNFNNEKINNIFSNVSTLDIYKLFNLKKDYEKLGYSSNDVFIHLLKLTTTPILYGILVVLSATIMFGINNKNSILLLLSLGLLISVGIYYMNFFFTSLGSTGKIPLVLSVFFPYLIISIISLIGLIGINEK